MANIYGTSTQFDPKAYDKNNPRALKWFREMAAQFGLRLVDGYDDDNKTLMVEMYKAGDLFFHDRRHPHIFRSAELEIRNTGWNTGHWNLGPDVHILMRKISSPSAVYIQFNNDGDHAVCLRPQDRRSETEVVVNRRGEEIMAVANVYNCLFLVKQNGKWITCKDCHAKYDDESGSTKPQRSLRRLLGVRKNGLILRKSPAVAK